MNIVCCVACGWGSTQTKKKEIERSVLKYGQFICSKCESDFERILSEDKELKIETPFGTCEALITEDTIYRFEADRPKVIDPKSPFVGFGGAWFLIVKDYHDGKRKVMVSNNLWHVKTIPSYFRSLFKEKGKINSIVIPVKKGELIELENTLQNIPFL